jgi:hypothetical protein
MKQREDNLTADMFGKEPKATVYMFYVETTDGECIEWNGLTHTKAKQMYAYTNASNPSNVARCGWEEIK